MAKYIHKNLVKFIKIDAKIIKDKTSNSSLTKGEILNTLSGFFGWRHFNELQSNAQREYLSFNSNFIDIGTLDFSSLEDIKIKYLKFVQKSFEYKSNKKYDYDFFQLRHAPFGKLKNQKEFYLKEKEGGSTLNISFINSESFIRLNNENLEELMNLYFDILIEEQEKRDPISGSMWTKRSRMMFNSILNALKTDKQELNYQDMLIKLGDFDNLYEYFLEREDKDNIEELCDFIHNLPGISLYSGDEIADYGTREQLGFAFMGYSGILKSSFLLPDLRNKNYFRLDELKKFDGNIKVKYYDSGDTKRYLDIIKKII